MEEHIGSVSTALTEEQFAKWVNQSVYKAKKSDGDVNKITVDDVNDVKRSICQVLVCSCIFVFNYWSQFWSKIVT